MNIPRLVLRFLAYVILPAAIVVTILLQRSGYSTPLRAIKQVPEFQLTERSGKPFGLADLKGKVWIADFMYSTCPGPCPMMSSRLSELQDTLFRFDDVRFVSITTNPQVDTPEVLRGYAEKFHASTNKWLFLTGDKARIYELGNKGFLLSVAELKDGTEPVVHSTKLALVDRTGMIRGYYSTEGEGNREKIIRDVETLLRE
jgi:protein SCO1/2